MIFAFTHLLLLTALGYAGILAWIPTATSAERLAFAPALGIAIALLASMLLALSPHPLFTPAVLAGTLVAILLATLWTGRKRLSLLHKDSGALALFAFVLLVIALLQDRWLIVAMSPDSHQFVGYATEIVLNRGAMLAHGFAWTTTRPAVVALAEAPAQFWGEDIHPLITIFVGVGVIMLMALALWPKRPRTSLSGALASLVLLAFATTGHYLYASFYIHSNLLTALALLAATMALNRAIGTQTERWLFLSVPFLILLGLTRLEAPILSVIAYSYALCLYPADAEFPTRAAVKAGIATAIPLVLWLILLYAMPKGYIINDAQVIAEIVLVTSLPFIPFAIRALRSRSKLVDAIPLISTAALAVLLLLFLLLKPHHMLTSLDALFANAFGSAGRWTHAWGSVIVICTACLVLGARIDRRTIFVGSIAVTGVLFIGALVFFRPETAPYRVDFGDSGNRMLLHVFPLMWLCAGFLALGLLPEKESCSLSKLGGIPS